MSRFLFRISVRCFFLRCLIVFQSLALSHEIDRKARKAEAEGRRSSWSNPSYAKGVLKAGSEDCAALRRKSEHRGFVARMTREERTKYDQEVREIMLRKCAKRVEKLQ